MGDLFWRPLVRFSQLDAGLSPAQYAAAHTTAWSGLRAALPPNVHLLTVQAYNTSRLLLRLSHSFEAAEDVGGMSADANVDLAALFSGSVLGLTACTETTLTANQALAAAPQWTYSVSAGDAVTLPVVPPAPQGPAMSVTLSALQIRSFLCDYVRGPSAGH